MGLRYSVLGKEGNWMKVNWTKEGRRETRVVIAKSIFGEFLMRSNWGWVGAGRGNWYKLGIAWADGEIQGEAVKPQSN